MTTRRNALKLFGMAPLGAKKASQAIVEKLAGDATMQQLAGISAMPSGAQDTCNPSPVSGRDWKDKLKAWFRLKQPIPSWHEDEIRRQHQFVVALDVDIAAKKSWSMSVKIITQRERNVQRTLKNLERNIWLDDQKQEFYERYGIWL